MKKELSIREYLCLYSVAFKDFFMWISFLLLAVACFDALTYLLGRPIVPDGTIKQLQTVSPVIYIFVFAILVAPIFEECLFRGFLFAGLLESRLGAPGAIAITALTWAAVHFQYDLYTIALIFILGNLLGFARLRTRSLYVPTAMHATANSIAMLEASIAA